MVMNLDSFVTEQSLQSLMDERKKAYEQRAYAFLAGNFGPSVGICDEIAVYGFIRQCYDQAVVRKISTEKDHFHYLNIAYHWGVEFETDSQHMAALKTASWTNPDGSAAMPVSLNSLLQELSAWDRVFTKDLHDTRRLQHSFAKLYTQPPAELDAARTMAFLRATFPNRFQQLPETNWIDFARSVYDTLETLALNPEDIICCIGLAVYFGHGFLDDPRFGWARDALANDGRDLEERRLALGHAVFAYWDGLEEGSVVKNG